VIADRTYVVSSGNLLLMPFCLDARFPHDHHVAYSFFRRLGAVQGVESCKIVFQTRHFCCRMYRLATMHSDADRRTDRRSCQ